MGSVVMSYISQSFTDYLPLLGIQVLEQVIFGSHYCDGYRYQVQGVFVRVVRAVSRQTLCHQHVRITEKIRI